MEWGGPVSLWRKESNKTPFFPSPKEKIQKYPQHSKKNRNFAARLEKVYRKK